MSGWNEMVCVHGCHVFTLHINAIHSNMEMSIMRSTVCTTHTRIILDWSLFMVVVMVSANVSIDLWIEFEILSHPWKENKRKKKTENMRPLFHIDIRLRIRYTYMCNVYVCVSYHWISHIIVTIHRRILNGKHTAVRSPIIIQMKTAITDEYFFFFTHSTHSPLSILKSFCMMEWRGVAHS